MTDAEKIAAALAEMDRSMYGDPEVPFRMRALLTAESPEPEWEYARVFEDETDWDDESDDPQWVQDVIDRNAAFWPGEDHGRVMRRVPAGEWQEMPDAS